jgi:hypothetical protein
VSSKDEEIAAADARIAQIEATIAQTEAVLYDPDAKPAKVAAAERYLVGARSALSQAQARRRALDR